MKYKSLGILGSTGSIGVQTLSLIKKEKSQIRLSFISCNKNIALLKKQVQLYKPKYILIKNTAAYLKFLNKNQNLKCRVFNDLNKLVKKINGKIDYINSHGTSTPIGDIKELEAISEVFNEDKPYISSTKSLTGHSLGATGVHEAIYSLLMLKNNFLSGSANIENLDDIAKKHNILQKTIDKDDIQNVMSNSFGFGGTNATLIFSKLND